MEDKSSLGLSGCYERKNIGKLPIYEKTGEPKYFLIHDDECWKFTSDENGSEVISKLRYLDSY